MKKRTMKIEKGEYFYYFTCDRQKDGFTYSNAFADLEKGKEYIKSRMCSTQWTFKML